MSIFTTFILINQWVMMTCVRTHYFIDMIAGLIISHYAFMFSEKLTYFFDVRVLGIPGHKRSQHYWVPCKKCGWSNPDASDVVPEEERQRMKA